MTKTRSNPEKREESYFQSCHIFKTFMSISQKIFTRHASKQKSVIQCFPVGAVVKNPPANAGDTDSSPGRGRSHMPQSN